MNWAWLLGKDNQKVEREMAIPKGKSAILIVVGNSGPEGVEYRDRPAAQVVADLLVTADSLSREIATQVAQRAGVEDDPAVPLTADAQNVADLLMLARKLALATENRIAQRTSLIHVPVQEEAAD